MEPGSPESLARGMLTKGLPMNPGELPASPQHWAIRCRPTQMAPGLPGVRAAPDEKRTTLKRSLLLPRETRGAGMGRRAVL
ncbi:MAG: hypothetical protein MZV63_40135 [Marinilabiliales bacterium]|nr:hypothetical protein [Marinilabiliales bacterium]